MTLTGEQFLPQTSVALGVLAALLGTLVLCRRPKSVTPRSIPTGRSPAHARCSHSNFFKPNVYRTNAKLIFFFATFNFFYTYHCFISIFATIYWLPDPGYQILAFRSWLPDPGFQHPGCQILASRSWLPDPGYQIPATRSWLPYPGCLILATRSWLAGPGYQILATTSGLPDLGWLPDPSY